MPEAWLRYQQDLALAAFVAGCSIADLMLRLAEASVHQAQPDRAALRLVSDLYGIEIDPAYLK